MNDLKHNNFVKPMPIQAISLRPPLEGRDLIGQAKTGTGKTLAFAIPIIEKTDTSKKVIQALIMTPTRELAEQVSKEIRKVGHSKRVRVAAFYGGKSITNQVRDLEHGVHVLVGTPGRILDLLDRRILRFDQVKILVLDEADMMLDMGFIDDIKKIMSNVPAQRQTILYSATMPDEIKHLARKFMKNPEMVSVSPQELVVEEIDQVYYETPQKQKLDTFMEVVRSERPESAIIFCNTKRWAHTLSELMQRRGLRTQAIHGDLSQNQRDRVIDGFKTRNIKFMVATDVAARGLHIENVSHIFNYDLPKDKGNYVHRIGRTGRAGKKGKAITFVTPQEIHDLWGIEHACRTKIKNAREA